MLKINLIAVAISDIIILEWLNFADKFIKKNQHQKVK